MMKFGTLVRIAAAEEARAKFEQLRASGMDACQLVYKPETYLEAEADLIRQAAEDNGVEISAFFAGFRDTYTGWDCYYDFVNSGINSPVFGAGRIAYLLSALPFIQRLGVTDVIIHGGYIPNNPFEAGYTSMAAAVSLLARHLKAFGMNLLFETGQESPVTLLRLILDVGADNLFVNFDTANMILYGYGNPVDALPTIGKYIRNTHFKDGLPPTKPGLGTEVKIGTGHVDFSKVVKGLKALDYDRYIIFEREISGPQQLEDIVEAIGYIKALWAQE